MLCSAPALSLVLLAAAIGCGGESAERLQALKSTPARAAIRLGERLQEAHITLGPGNLPAGSPTGGRVPVEGWRPVQYEDETIWQAPLSVRLPQENAFVKPPWIEVLQEDSTLPFCNLPGPRGCWDLYQGDLRLASGDDPSTWRPGVSLEVSALTRADARLDPVASGLAPLDYLRGALTLGGDTRPGLWLPAPSALRWTLSIPPGATLELAAGLAEPAAPWGRSDGASLRVTVNGEPLASLALSPGEGFAPLRVSLAARAGQTVTIGLETRCDGSPDYDYVLVADPTIWATAARAPRRVVLVGIDTLRADALSQDGYRGDTTVALDDFAAASVRFPRTWTPAPRTRPSFQAALTGRWPARAPGALTLGQRLRDSGFATAGFSANLQLDPRFGFSRGYGLWRYRARRDATGQLSDAADWLADQGDRDAMVFVHLMDPHAFYEAPPPYTDRYTSGASATLSGRENRWAVLEAQRQGRLSPADRRWLRGRYDGEVRYMADTLAGFLQGLEDLPGDTLTVVFSDHGEEFWDHRGYEHNHTLYEELVRGVLWIHPPGGGGAVVQAPVDTVDIAPTVLALLGLPATGLDGRSLAPLVDPAEASAALEAALDSRPLPLGYLMYDRERWGVVAAGGKYLLETWSGRQALYDLESDPLEQRDRSAEVPAAELAAWWARLEAATGAPVGAGWRLHLDGISAPFSLRFTAPLRAAAVLDPESALQRRANLGWGELPDLLASEVGQIALSEDRMGLMFSPGVEPSGGVIGLIFEDPDTAAVVSSGGGAVVIPAQGGPAALGGGAIVRAVPGAVILPAVGELAAEGGSAEQLGTLRALGYVK